MGVRSQPSNGVVAEPLQYDPEFNGPLKNRSCTDILFLLIFLVFIGVWAGIGAYAIAYGDPSMLLVPKDSLGRRCGKDYDVRDKPYLFFFDLTKCLEPDVPFIGCKTRQVCVDKCPDTDAFSREEIDPKFCDPTPNDCPNWYLTSTSVLNRCLYNVAARKNSKNRQIARVGGDEITFMKSVLNPIHIWLSLAVHNGIEIFTKDQNIQQIGQGIVEDIMHIWWKILIGVGLALVACIIYILMLRWVAAPMVWLSIFGALGCLAGGIYFTAIKYKEFKDQKTKYEEDGRSITTKRDLWLTGLIILSVFTGIILLMLIFLRKRIVLAIALIKEGSKAVSSVTASLFFPIFPWVMQVSVIAYGIAVALFLTSTGSPLYKTRNVNTSCENTSTIKDNTVCVPEEFAAIVWKAGSICKEAQCKFIKMENDALYPYLQAYNIVGFFWVAFFVSALAQMVLAGVFAEWYWTWDKRTLPFFAVTSALSRTLRYHIGTLAFGSLIITICRLIRLCLEYIDQKIKRYDNEVTKAILCCCKCFFYCLEKFLKFINKNAYIMCAIHGKNFCASARDAFSLLMRNIVRVFVLDKVTDFLFFLSKILLTLGVGAVSYVIFVSNLVSPFIDNSTLNYGAVPVTIIMIATYLISSIFFSVYSMAVDTLFLCFLEDCERNDGSSQKPYYMSKSLMRIFGKKNKRD